MSKAEYRQHDTDKKHNQNSWSSNLMGAYIIKIERFQDLTPEASHSATAEHGLPIMFCAFRGYQALVSCKMIRKKETATSVYIP